MSMPCRNAQADPELRLTPVIAADTLQRG